jgi:hypothetical protein
VRGGTLPFESLDLLTVEVDPVLLNPKGHLLRDSIGAFREPIAPLRKVIGRDNREPCGEVDIPDREPESVRAEADREGAGEALDLHGKARVRR